MVERVSSDIDDFINKIKKLFKFETENFDLDFFIFPESNVDFEEDPKGFKISYHFEEGKEKPEVNIENDIGEGDLKDFLINSQEKRARSNKNLNPGTKNTFDAVDVIFNEFEEQSDVGIKEPCTEINDFDSFTEIIIEIPGIRRENISMDFDEANRILSFYAEKDGQSYLKDIQIPHASSNEDVSVEINNGLVIIKVSSETNK